MRCGELGAAASHDPAVDEHVDVVGDELLEELRVVRDDEHGHRRGAARARSRTPRATARSASMSSPESVSSRIATSGSRSAIWRISLRLRSPPENPSFRWRSANARSMPEAVHPLGEVEADLEDAEVLEALARGDRLAEELDDRDARDRLGVLEGEEEPGARALVGRPVGDVLAAEEDLALGDAVAGAAHDERGEGRLARAVGAHERVDLALVDDEVDARAGSSTPSAIDVQVAQLEDGRLARGRAYR